MTGRPANAEMIEGYRDGRNLDSPEPSGNRSFSYRHGFANGRDDRRGKPRDTFENISRMADEAMLLDDGPWDEFNSATDRPSGLTDSQRQRGTTRGVTDL